MSTYVEAGGWGSANTGFERGPNGARVEGTGVSTRPRSATGNFRNAHQMATDSRGNLYTAELNPGSRVQKFIFKGVKQ